MQEAEAVQEADTARKRRWSKPSKPTAAPAQAAEAEAARKSRWSKPTTTARARAVEAALAPWRRLWLTSVAVLPAHAVEAAPSS